MNYRRSRADRVRKGKFKRSIFHVFNDFWRHILHRQEKKRSQGPPSTNFGPISKPFLSLRTFFGRIGDVNKTNTLPKRKHVFVSSEPAAIQQEHVIFRHHFKEAVRPSLGALRHQMEVQSQSTPCFLTVSFAATFLKNT